ncbi:MAG: molecular chaperone DnaK, partial [Deltaproteobacteria bacterium]|nr:molecular chaperone DnaK [Deltaproteobacteria bacterium]
IELEDRKFEVLANQPVSFDMYSSSYRSGDRSGDLVKIDDSLTPLPPIQTIVQFGKKGVKTNIPINIQADYTEMGSLALWCRSLVSNHRWQLQFQLRDAALMQEVDDAEIFEASLVEACCEEIKRAIKSRSNGGPVETLGKTIEKIVQRPKAGWPLGLIRSMSDELLNLVDYRKTSAVFEARWLNLTGFCMRPGFGDSFDKQRIKQLWKIYKQGAVFNKSPQNASEWWIMWRRVAGGLSSGQQRQFLQDLAPVMLSKKGTKKKMAPQQLMEIWMAVANMERLLVKDKITCGEYFISEIQQKKCKPQHFWALSRVGARELLYGPADKVVPPETAASWIKVMLTLTWHDPKPVAAAVAQMARKTGDRARDLEQEMIDIIIEWMSANDCASHARLLKDVVPMEKQEEST